MIVFIGVFFLRAAVAQAPSSFEPVGTMSQLMLDMIYPASNAIFYVQRKPPRTIRTGTLSAAPL